MLSRLNGRRGCFRLWVIFSLVWVSVNGYEAREGFKNAKEWAELGKKWSKSADEHFITAGKTPDFVPGGLDKRYYENLAIHEQNEAAECFQAREKGTEKYNTHLKMLGIPLLMFVFYFIAVWVFSGFLP